MITAGDLIVLVILWLGSAPCWPESSSRRPAQRSTPWDPYLGQQLTGRTSHRRRPRYPRTPRRPADLRAGLCAGGSPALGRRADEDHPRLYPGLDAVSRGPSHSWSTPVNASTHARCADPMEESTWHALRPSPPALTSAVAIMDQSAKAISALPQHSKALEVSFSTYDRVTTAPDRRSG